jgi:hypothetical protein
MDHHHFCWQSLQAPTTRGCTFGIRKDTIVTTGARGRIETNNRGTFDPGFQS